MLTLSLSGALCAALPGCKKEREVPPPPPSLPAQAGGAGQTHENPMPADHPPMLRGHSEGPAPGTAAAPSAAPAAAPSDPGGATLKGNLALSDKVKDKVKPGTTIFLVARTAFEGGATGPVLAVKKLTTGAWPQPFELSQGDVMMAGMNLSGKVVLTARIDQDGDAMTKMVGDVEGVSKPIDLPKGDVELVIDTVRTTAAGGPSPPNLGQPSGGMPPGHPPTEMPAGHPPTGMPAGHPPTGMPAGHP